MQRDGPVKYITILGENGKEREGQKREELFVLIT